MFLRYQGFSKRFPFDVIYSALQKSLRRGDEELAIEMGYEFHDYPNALKKRLIQNCSEDCPNLNLVNDIYNSPQDLPHLMRFIPIICKHIKNHDGSFGMRLACEKEPIKEPPILEDNHDDLMTLLRKCLYYIGQNNELTFISFFQKKYPTIDLVKIYKFIGENKTFLYMLCVFETTDYVHEKYEIKPFAFDKNKVFDRNLKLPEYVYDKHVRSGPKNHKTYEYFVNNLVLYPRKEESEIEKEAKKLLIETDRGINEILISLFGERMNKNSDIYDKNSNLERVDSKVKLLQIKTNNVINQKKVYFCSLNDGKKYNRILAGPFENDDIVDMQLLSDVIKQKLLSSASSYSSKKVSFQNQVCILSVNLIPIDKTCIIEEQSEKEESIPIYNGKRYIFSHEILDTLTVNEVLELLKILAFRKIIGTTGTCAKNIIHCFKHLYSINDPVLLQSSQFMFQDHLEKFEKSYDKIVSTNFKKICCFLNGWQLTLRNVQNIPDNIQSFMYSQISSLLKRENWKF